MVGVRVFGVDDDTRKTLTDRISAHCLDKYGDIILRFMPNPDDGKPCCNVYCSPRLNYYAGATLRNFFIDAIREVTGVELEYTCFYEFEDWDRCGGDALVKADNARGKRRWDLMPWNALAEVVKVLEHGAKKYSDDNWQKQSEGKSLYRAAAMRHLIAEMSGEKLDSDSGLSHLAHAACDILFLIWFQQQED